MVLADVAKRKANEIEAQAITGSGKKIIIMSNQKDTKCDSLFLLTSEMGGGILITSVSHPLRHTFLTSKPRYFLRLSPLFNSTNKN